MAPSRHSGRQHFCVLQQLKFSPWTLEEGLLTRLSLPQEALIRQSGEKARTCCADAIPDVQPMPGRERRGTGCVSTGWGCLFLLQVRSGREGILCQRQAVCRERETLAEVRRTNGRHSFRKRLLCGVFFPFCFLSPPNQTWISHNHISR